MSYDGVRKRWLADPEGFWAEAAEGIEWIEPASEVLDRSAPSGRWFRGGVLNTCYNALDRHADSDAADRTALIYDSAMTGAIRRFTYAELRDQVAQLAGAIQAAGLRRGDRALIYMPMIPEAVMAMLACARLGGDSFGGFRRLRRSRTGYPYHPGAAEADTDRQLRPGAQPRGGLQALAG